MGKALDPNSYASTATAVSVNFKTDAANDSSINNYGANLATQPLTNFEAIANTKGFQKIGQSVSNTIADLLGQGRASVNGSFKLPGWVGVVEAGTAEAISNGISDSNRFVANTAVAVFEGALASAAYTTVATLFGVSTGGIGAVIMTVAGATILDQRYGNQMREAGYSVLNSYTSSNFNYDKPHMVFPAGYHQ